MTPPRKRTVLATACLIVAAIVASPFLFIVMMGAAKDRR
jgi:hypothetical protein